MTEDPVEPRVEKRKRLSWGLPDSSRPKRPYRDTAFVYGAFAVLIVVVAWLTGGSVARAAVVAAAVYVAALGWSFRTWRNRLQAEKREERK